KELSPEEQEILGVNAAHYISNAERFATGLEEQK
ncbi:MAG: gamma carbonic anhydrase family protein, partial [Halioglobus sp.]|nr:gamma carbonic anhydrase family protein [Halioglobus sp.]